MGSESVSEHPLIAQLLTDIRPLVKAGLDRIRGLIAREGIARYTDPIQLPERDCYCVMCFRRASNLASAVDMLERIEHFVVWLPAQKRFRELRLSQERWLDYHYSYYLVVTSSLVDLSLLTVNEVLRLGFPDRLCNYNAVSENYWVSYYGIAKPLTTLYSLTKKHRERRNSFVHHGERPDLAEVIESKDYNILTFVAQANAMSARPIGGAKLFNEAFRLEIERMVSVMRRERSAAMEAVWTLFTALQPVYEAHLSALKPR